MIDVEAVGFDADRHHLGAQFPKGCRRDLVAGAVSAIDNHAHAFEVELARQGALGELDIARVGAVDALGAAKRRGAGEALSQICRPSGFSISSSTSSLSLNPSGPNNLMPLSS